MKRLIACSFIILLFAHRLGAQSLTIDWYKVANGGGTTTGGTYSLTATVGQPDAGGLSTGGDFSLSGGFWALSALQKPGGPTLGLRLTSTNTALIYWPSPSSGFTLMVSTNLDGGNWSGVSETVNDDGTLRYILINPPTGDRFYRLQSP